MQGRIYISGAFTSLKRAACADDDDWIDNDPHFWTIPPTWGICRTDYRRSVNVGDYVFFVLPKASDLPQMIYGYIRVKEKITHLEAYHRSELRRKRMGNKNPNGNIIVTADGSYNRFDKDVHRSRFEEIKQVYVIGDERDFQFLERQNIEKLRRLASEFLPLLNEIFEATADEPFEIITRKGRVLKQCQVQRLLTWLNEGHNGTTSANHN
jgi:hypothetical protein